MVPRAVGGACAGASGPGAVRARQKGRVANTSCANDARPSVRLVCGGEPACVLWLGCGGPEAHFVNIDYIHHLVVLRLYTLCGTATPTGVQYA